MVLFTATARVAWTSANKKVPEILAFGYLSKSQNHHHVGFQIHEVKEMLLFFCNGP
jgi:hypothetical protein